MLRSAQGQEIIMAFSRRQFGQGGAMALLALLMTQGRRAMAGISEAPILYAASGRTFEGTVVRPMAVARLKSPVVIIAHDFLGLGPNQLKVANQLAGLGFLVVAVDYYGQGRRPRDLAEATAFANSVRGSVPELRAIVRAAYDAT